MKTALQEHQNVSGQGIRSECSDIHLAYGPAAPGTHMFILITDKNPLGSVSDREASEDMKVKPEFSEHELRKM